MELQDEIRLEAYYISLRKTWQSKEDNWKEGEMLVEIRRDIEEMTGVRWGQEDI